MRNLKNARGAELVVGVRKECFCNTILQRKEEAMMRIVFAVILLISTGSAIAAVDIHNIQLNYGRYWWAGVPESKPYDLWGTVTGTVITGITMTPPGGSPVALDHWGGNTWGFGDSFSTEADLYAAYPRGLYEFNINAGEDGEDSVTINHNPVEPTDFPNITYPTDNATNVPLGPTITWQSCVGYGDALILALWDETGGGGQIEWLNIAATSWNPGPLESGHVYELEAAVVDGSAFQPYNGTTSNGDPFDYYDLFLYENTIQFTATPAVMLAETALFIMAEVDLGHIDPKLEGSLLAKVNAALSALEKDKPNAAKVAMNNLKALINQVEAQTGKKIAPEAAAEIIQQANTIIAILAG